MVNAFVSFFLSSPATFVSPPGTIKCSILTTYRCIQFIGATSFEGQTLKLNSPTLVDNPWSVPESYGIICVGMYGVLRELWGAVLNLLR